ncbi:DUF892 family protein [Pseudomonas sp. RIT-PI-S]|uniref:ferritin-like domain-containing protein n=1 Tax=Pseudomonas sp. RIT-PI-S TaxID=3035295 RepID=UPI0021DA7962|nr:DUF892 family protein [Pseudomonas sp. RIT-PI-S]
MASVQDNLLDWLKDAHAMERQAEDMLTAQAKRLEHYPDLKQRIEQHIEETRWQQGQVDAAIKRLGGSPSVLKDIGGKAMAFGQAMAGMTMPDEVIKGSMSGYVFENLEIATYTVLITAARAAGDEETAMACEAILKQEEAMAQWILEHLGPTTQQFLGRSQNPDLEAKR